MSSLQQNNQNNLSKRDMQFALQALDNLIKEETFANRNTWVSTIIPLVIKLPVSLDDTIDRLINILSDIAFSDELAERKRLGFIVSDFLTKLPILE